MLAPGGPSSSSPIGEPVAGSLAPAGVPVVDGVHFQAPGCARLPFSGGAAGIVAAPSLARAARARDRARCLGVTPRRTLAMISANSLSAAVQGQFMFVLPWMLLALGQSPQAAALATAFIYVPMLVTAVPPGRSGTTRPRSA